MQFYEHSGYLQGEKRIQGSGWEDQYTEGGKH
jgi:hypothetical protein